MTGNWYKIVKEALKEDIGDRDITTDAILEKEKEGRARIISKQKGILAGVHVAEHVFYAIDPELKIEMDYKNGDEIKKGNIIIQIHGSVSSILKAERVALNFLAHLSGIATLTKKFVNKINNDATKIIDTRKTTPMLRALEKEAVRAGGGYNHRMGLYDMVLIKENHIRAAGGIGKAVNQTKKFLKQMNIDAKIEVETTNVNEIQEALECKIHRIMLDNMAIDKMKNAVNVINGKVEVEASGGVTLDNISKIADTGVDYISLGAITHSAPAFDFSLLLED